MLSRSSPDRSAGISPNRCVPARCQNLLRRRLRFEHVPELLRDPTAAYVNELHDTGHAATPRHAAWVFQMGSAESGATIKVRSAVRPQTPGQRMVVRVPPFDHPK